MIYQGKSLAVMIAGLCPRAQRILARLQQSKFNKFQYEYQLMQERVQTSRVGHPVNDVDRIQKGQNGFGILMY